MLHDSWFTAYYIYNLQRSTERIHFGPSQRLDWIGGGTSRSLMQSTKSQMIQYITVETASLATVNSFRREVKRKTPGKVIVTEVWGCLWGCQATNVRDSTCICSLVGLSKTTKASAGSANMGRGSNMFYTSVSMFYTVTRSASQNRKTNTDQIERQTGEQHRRETGETGETGMIKDDQKNDQRMKRLFPPISVISVPGHRSVSVEILLAQPSLAAENLWEKRPSALKGPNRIWMDLKQNKLKQLANA